MSTIDSNDLIYYSDNDGKIYSGGFSVNSIMIKEGLSPIMTLNNVGNNSDDKENISDLFKDLVIPSWSLHYPNNKIIINGNMDNDDKDSDEYISDDLYDKLLNLVTVSEKELRGGKKLTKKMKIKNNKNNKKYTKRNF